jgi:hypothetical protein
VPIAITSMDAENSNAGLLNFVKGIFIIFLNPLHRGSHKLD